MSECLDRLGYSFPFPQMLGFPHSSNRLASCSTSANCKYSEVSISSGVFNLLSFSRCDFNASRIISISLSDNLTLCTFIRSPIMEPLSNLIKATVPLNEKITTSVSKNRKKFAYRYHYSQLTTVPKLMELLKEC